MRKVLVVDDDEEVGDLLAFSLRSAGYEPLLCRDGAEGWDRLRREGADLAVLDVNMPRMSGLELCALIRAEARWRAMPILLLTVRARTEEQEEGYQTGADDYLPKPFSVQVLVARVRALERRLLGAAPRPPETAS